MEGINTLQWRHNGLDGKLKEAEVEGASPNQEAVCPRKQPEIQKQFDSGADFHDKVANSQPDTRPVNWYGNDDRNVRMKQMQSPWDVSANFGFGANEVNRQEGMTNPVAVRGPTAMGWGNPAYGRLHTHVPLLYATSISGHQQAPRSATVHQWSIIIQVRNLRNSEFQNEATGMIIANPMVVHLNLKIWSWCCSSYKKRTRNWSWLIGSDCTGKSALTLNRSWNFALQIWRN